MAGNGRDTKRDYVVQLIWRRLQDEMAWRALCQFVDKQDIDSDCIDDDMELFGDEKTSILHEALQVDDADMNALQDFLRHHRIMSKSFATGFPLFYWKWRPPSSSSRRTTFCREVTWEDILSGNCLYTLISRVSRPR